MTPQSNSCGATRHRVADARGLLTPLCVCLSTAALIALLSSTAWGDGDPNAQSIQIHPSISLEIDASDNIRRTASDRQSDIILVPQTGLLVSGATTNLKLFLSGGLQYDDFINERSLDRLTGNLLSHGELTIVPGFFFLDGSAQISDEFLKLADQSPSGLPNGNPQGRVFNTQLRPYITTHLFDEADLTVRTGIAEVQFTSLAGASSLLPSDSTIYQGSTLLTNGERSRRVEWRLTTDYTLENRDDGSQFQSADGMFGLTVKVTPKIHAIGRIGYELVQDPTIPDIRDVAWSGGLAYQFGEASTITAERRHSFGRDGWYGDVNLALSSMFSITGGYEERLETEQQRLSSSLGDAFAQSGNLPPPPTPVSLTEDLVNQAFYIKDARLGGSYRSDQQKFDFSATLAQREFESINDHDESVGVSTRFSQTLPANLIFNLVGDYSATLEPRIGQVKTQSYTASGGFSYMVGDNARARLEYTWSRTDGSAVIDENLVAASISKSF